MKGIELYIRSILPEDMQDIPLDLTARGLNSLLVSVMKSHPDKFAEISKKIMDVGRNTTYMRGETITLKDLEAPFDRKKVFDEMDIELGLAQSQNPDKFESLKPTIYQKYIDKLENLTTKNALAQRNHIATAVLSGARGKNPQLRAMITSPGTFSDYKGDMVDYFVRESFADGIRPGAVLASAPGSRASVIQGKNCLEENTPVRMADLSVKPIKDIQVGEWVLGADKAGKVFPVKVLNVFNQGKKDVYRYFFKLQGSRKDFQMLDATEDHQVLMVTNREYTRQRALYSRGNGPKPSLGAYHQLELLPTSRLVRSARGSSHSPVKIQGGFSGGSKEEPWARLLGLLIGDGCLTGKSAVYLSCADDALIADIQADLKEVGHKIKKCSTENYSWHLTKTDYKPADNNSIHKGISGFVKGSKSERTQLLETYGLLGKYAWEKRFPIGWEQWTRESIINLIAGFFAADGCSHQTKQTSGRVHTGVTFSVTSKELVDDLELALAVVLGISSNRWEGYHKNRGKKLFSLAISRVEDVKTFAELVGPSVPGMKRITLLENSKVAQLKQNNPYAKFCFYEKKILGVLSCKDLEVDHPDHLFVLANGMIVSNSTARGGDLGKIAAQTAQGQVVRQMDCGIEDGVAYDLDDSSLPGRILATDAGGLPAGTPLTRTALQQLRKKNVDSVVARSPLTCQQANGLCAKCVGYFYNGGKLPRIGEAVGLNASTTIFEPVIQGALNSKHTAGMSSGKREYSGLDYIAQYVQSPETFPNKAIVSEVDGRVEEIREAPQGGFYVTVGDEQHYVAPDHPVLVKEGDSVEAGDQLSEGLIDPEDIVRLRGLGAGRKEYTERLGGILQASGAATDKRNIEVLARAALDDIQIDSADIPGGLSGYLPDDIVSYNTLQSTYVAPEDAKPVKLQFAKGQYLQKPALHYSIGSRVTNKMIKELEAQGRKEVVVTEDAPQFTPIMTRLRTTSHNNPDWLARLNTSYIKDHYSKGALRGDDSNVLENDNYSPRLVYGEGFGQNAETTGSF